jgi:hypothetical protein
MRVFPHTASLLDSPCHGYILLLDYHHLLFLSHDNICVVVGDYLRCLYPL